MLYSLSYRRQSVYVRGGWSPHVYHIIPVAMYTRRIAVVNDDIIYYTQEA